MRTTFKGTSRTRRPWARASAAQPLQSRPPAPGAKGTAPERVPSFRPQAALQEIGTMTMLPSVFLPVLAVEKLWSLLGDGDQVGDGCANIEEVRAAAK